MSDRYSNVFALLQIISLFFITISTSRIITSNARKNDIDIGNNNVNKLSNQPLLETTKYVNNFIRLYKKKAKDNINNINSMIQYGEALMKIGKYEKAEKAFKRAYKLEPINLRVLENLDALVFNYNVDAIGKFKKFKDYPLPPLRYNNRLNAQLSPNNLYEIAENKDTDGATGKRDRFIPSDVKKFVETNNSYNNEMELNDLVAFHKFVYNGNFSSVYWEKKPLLIHLINNCSICSEITFRTILTTAAKSSYVYSKNRINTPPFRNINYMKKTFANRMESKRENHDERDIIRALQFGYTLQFLGIQRSDKFAARFAFQLSRSSQRPVNINMYITPPNVKKSLSAHTDFQGSFMVQLHGKKRWRLWMYDELELPVRYRHIRGRDEGDEVYIADLGKPFLDVVLNPGDILFVPRGCLHTTSTPPTINDENKKRNNNNNRVEKTCPFKPKNDGKDEVLLEKSASGKIQDNGGWFYTKDFIFKHHVEFDSGFGNAINDFLDGQSVIDLGAGIGQLGFYLKNIDSNIEWHGFDGGQNIEEFVGEQVRLLTNRNTYVVPHMCWMDLSTKIDFQSKNLVQDWAISVEVGEHIPKEYESIFFDNLQRASRKGVILTWAKIGQGGLGHYNEQDNPYVIQQMVKRGFVYDLELSLYFRSTATTHNWLDNTIMVFWKKTYYADGKMNDEEKTSSMDWMESSIHLTVGVEVMNDAHLSTTWEALFGAGEFFRHDHIIEAYYKALGIKIDQDKRFRAGVPRELISGNGDQSVWKKEAKHMMHEVVDSMFEKTDLLKHLQKIFERTHLHRNTRLYRLIGEAMKFDAMNLEMEEEVDEIIEKIFTKGSRRRKLDELVEMEVEASSSINLEENIVVEDEPAEEEDVSRNVMDVLLEDTNEWWEED